MRLFSIVFVTMFLVVGSARPELITVCASGCDQTTLAAAKTACVACTIRVTDGSQTDNFLTVDDNKILMLEGTGRGTTITSTNTTAGVTITTGLTQAFVIRNVVLRKTTSAVAVVFWSGLGAGASVSLSNVYILQETTASGFVLGAVLNGTNLLNADRCTFHTTSTNGAFRIGGLIITGNTFYLKNCIFKAPIGTGFLNNTSVHVASIGTLAYCDFVGCSTAYNSIGSGTVVNSILSGNTTDRNLTAPAATTDFSYCAYTNSNANPGTGSITITAARTFCDPTNYYISPASQTLNAGVSIAGVTGTDIGLNGVLQGSGNILGMGCNPYSLALCGGYGVGK